MMKVTLAAALEAARRRNAQIAAAYKEASRHLVSRAVSGLAAAAADQRRELGTELDAFAGELPPAMAALAVELPDSAVSTAMAAPPDLADQASALSFFRNVEEAERGIYTLFAAAAAADPDVAAALAAFAEQARKRSAVAQDHLDLLALRP